MTHTHVTGWSHAWRLLLARLHFDYDARKLIRTEISNCSECWLHIADAAIEIAEIGLAPTGDPRPALSLGETQIALALDADQADDASHQPTRESIADIVRQNAAAWARYRGAVRRAWAT